MTHYVKTEYVHNVDCCVDGVWYTNCVIEKITHFHSNVYYAGVKMNGSSYYTRKTHSTYVTFAFRKESK